MSLRAKFIVLLIITVILMSFLMNSYSFSAPHKKNPIALDFLTIIVFVGVFVGLLIFIVLALYVKDIPGAESRVNLKLGDAVSIRDIALFLFYNSLLSTSWVIMMMRITASIRNNNNVTNVSIYRGNNTTLLNNSNNSSVVPPVRPLIEGGGNGNYTTKFLNNPIATHLWLVFLLPIFLGLVYLGYYYYRLGQEELKRKRKIEKAIEFDRKLNEFGLERFSNPREAIVEIYKNAVLWLEGLGIPYRESWTHWEHAEHVKYMHEAFVELAKLFEKAKYAPERIEWRDAEKALEIYNRLRGKAREIAKMD